MNNNNNNNNNTTTFASNNNDKNSAKYHIAQIDKLWLELQQTAFEAAQKAAQAAAQAASVAAAQAAAQVTAQIAAQAAAKAAEAAQAAVLEITLRAEERIKKERLRLLETIEDLYNKAPCGYHSLDADAVFVHINETELKWLGYEADEVIGRMKLPDILSPEDAEVFKANYPLLTNTSGDLASHVYNLRFTFRRKDGSEFPALVQAAAVYDMGKYIMSRATVLDMTSLDLLEREKEKARKYRLEKEEAENLSKAKTQFMANMSHELRTPMNAIIGFTDLVLMSEDLAEGHFRNLSLVSLAAKRLLSLINNILDVSKMDTGLLILEEQSFNLSSLMEEAASLCQILIKDKKIDLRVNADGIPEALVGDPHRLHQVLVNLLGNAIKFTEAGSIALSVELQTRNETRAVLKFSVSDTGMGIPSKLMGSLFTYFGQLNSSMTKKYGGSGLGLAISKACVESMGGRIWVESVEGKGSTFHFTVEMGIPACGSLTEDAHPVVPE